MKMNKTILYAIIVIAVLAGIYLFFAGDDKKAVQEAVDTYITAVKNRNFDVIYRMSASSQKRALFILTGSDTNKDELLKQYYNEQKTAFDSVQPAVNLSDLWAEKAVFVPDMKYRMVTKAMMEADKDNPTAFYRKRINATVEIEIEYTKKDTAPVFEGRSVKKAIYVVKMIHSKNIGKTIKAMTAETGDRWLFKGVSVKDGSIVYW